jgi:DNA-binding beta-propeller fold protein YncE
MVQTRVRSSRVSISLILILSATFVLSVSGSGATLKRGGGYTPVATIPPLPELGGEMCLPIQMAAVPPEENLLALMQQQAPGGRATPRPAANTNQRIVIDRAPVRTIKDSAPGFSGVTIDPIRNEIIVNDENLFQIVTYDRNTNTPARAAFSEPKRVIAGPKAIIDYQCGIYVDPKTGDIYTLSNDVGDVVSVYKYGSQGNSPPIRSIRTGRGYGLAADEEREELYVTRHNSVGVYRKQADGEEKPLRTLGGTKTRIGSIQGIAIDKKRNIIFLSSHGNFGGGRSEQGAHYESSLITVYPLDAQGNVEPIRVIQGPKTTLNHPGLIFADQERGELYVANNLDDSVLVFSAEANGDVAPLRIIKGSRTRLKEPRSVVVDLKNDELIVSNLGNHSISVFPRAANGNVAPLRVIRAAPEGKLALGMANPGALAYDSRRDLILAPN